MARATDSELRRLVRRALAEDRYRADRTTAALFRGPTAAEAVVLAEGFGLLSGVRAAVLVGREAGLRVRAVKRDGSRVRPGTVVLRIQGDARAILSVERTLLNLLMHASGVASLTASAVQAAGGRSSGLEVWATRKTLPGLRELEKAAVVDGGGHPHRRDLATGILVKNNHLALLPLETAVRRARQAARAREPVEVEVRSTTQALRAARAGADVLLLDNTGPARARSIVLALVRAGLRGRLRVELSGGITVANLARYRRTGADRASLGSLTHSAPALPFHLRLKAVGRALSERPA